MLARLLYACSVERPENKFSNDLFSARWRFTPFRLKIYSMQARAWSANVQIVKTIPDIHNVALRLGLRLITVSMFVSLPIIAGNWPQWRGPQGTGVSSERNLPLRWSTNENVRWRVPLPERGNSTPIVWDQRVFITQAEGSRRTVRCLNRDDGKLLWQSGVTYPEKEASHETNPLCSASPVTDGERVIVSSLPLDSIVTILTARNSGIATSASKRISGATAPHRSSTANCAS